MTFPEPHPPARSRHVPLDSILAVAAFQLTRLRGPLRLLMAAMGVVFPAAVMLAVRWAANAIQPGGGDDLDVGREVAAVIGIDREIAATLLYALIPEAVCMLGLLVTMCPAVADELERGTWIHVAVRPGGRTALLLGTYLAAVAWTSCVAILGVVLAVFVAGVENPLSLINVLAWLVILSAIGRGALFALPAVILPKRALVASVAVALVVEYMAGFIPAVINQATVSLRLRSLLVAWMGWRYKVPADMRLLVDPQPPWLQVTAVLALAAVLLTAATVILEYRQFPPSEEI
jgi:ABC-type transport system involved in multi-copper enzyme maturation permease subunit